MKAAPRARCRNAVPVGNAEHIGYIGRGKESRYDVTQDNGLFQALEKKRHNACAYQNQRKVGNERFKL
jgi:hypothetical protein